MDELRQLVESMPDDWRIRAVLLVTAVLCYAGLVRGIGSFVSFGSYDDDE